MMLTNQTLTRTCVAILGWGLTVCTPNENPAKSPETARAESQEDMERTVQEASDDADAHLEEMQEQTGKALAGEQTGEPTEAESKQSGRKESDAPVATARPKGSDEPKQTDKPKQADESKD